MKSQLVLLLPFLLLSLIHEGNAQRGNRFMVNLVTNANVTLCVGTIITEYHVLAPASCVAGQTFGVQILGATEHDHVTSKYD